MAAFSPATLENKTAKAVAHPSYSAGSWGLRGTEPPKGWESGRTEGGGAGLPAQTAAARRGQRLPQWLPELSQQVTVASRAAAERPAPGVLSRERPRWEGPRRVPRTCPEGGGARGAGPGRWRRHGGAGASRSVRRGDGARAAGAEGPDTPSGASRVSGLGRFRRPAGRRRRRGPRHPQEVA